MGGDTKDLSRKHHSKGHPKEIVYQILELPRTTSLDPMEFPQSDGHGSAVF